MRQHNRLITYLLLCVICVWVCAILSLFIPTTAYAWSLDGIKDWILDNALTVVFTGIFTLIAGFFGGTAIGKFILRAKVPIMELTDVAVKVHAARRPSSPEGRSITAEERDAILKEVEDVLKATVEAFGTKVRFMKGT